VLAIVSPGQGAQTPQMFEPWLANPRVNEILTSYSQFVGLDLIQLGTTAGAQEIKQTQISQPLIVAASLMTAELLDLAELNFDQKSVVLAGHSVGEFVAAYLSGAISLSSALGLVAARGSAMSAAAKSNSQTGMSAVLGGDKDQVISYLQSLELIAANVNASGQVVAAGLSSNLQKLSEAPLEGTRVRALDVSAAFHTDFMSSAKNDLAALLRETTFSDPVLNIISNKDGQLVLTGKDLREKLLNQIDSPVRWDLCQKYFVNQKVTGLLELAPGGVLTGIAKREVPEAELFAIKTPSDIENAKEFIKTHARVNS
jgi:[acyl-carrier-protein] S-malonyltransferase